VNGEFHAVHLLMKCPSKYTPEEITNKGLENTY
jgi:cytochrome c-type biogenesis protein CcmE